jgi:hypothetical protein
METAGQDGKDKKGKEGKVARVAAAMHGNGRGSLHDPHLLVDRGNVTIHTMHGWIGDWIGC